MVRDEVNTTHDHCQQEEEDNQLDEFNNNNNNDDFGYDEVDGRIKDRILSMIAKRARYLIPNLSKEGNKFVLKGKKRWYLFSFKIFTYNDVI